MEARLGVQGREHLLLDRLQQTGWRANDNFYSTAPSMNGPWTYQGYVAPVGKLTWMTQTTWVQPVVGSAGTTYVYWGDHWYGDQDTTAPGVHNYLTTYSVSAARIYRDPDRDADL